MGYDFRYGGKIKLSPGLTVKQVSILKRLRKGEEVPANGPEGYFSLKVNDDGDVLKHDGSEGQFFAAEWLHYLITGPLSNQTFNGKIEETCSDFQAQTDIIVENNVIYTCEYEMKPGPKVAWTGDNG